MKSSKLMKDIEWISDYPRILSEEIKWPFEFGELEKKLKILILEESRNTCLEFMKSCLLDNEVEECFSFEKDEPTGRSKKQTWISWLRIPGNNIDPDIYFKNEDYRKGIKDSMDLCRNKILLEMENCEKEYLSFKKELDKDL